ncbi:E3 ubiquitin-protein ligase PRT6 isoform X1 [Vigna angularis]|uniref:E3 ubiquitin-protein ligase PRT6 isoform X1 n=1 Tax=Phaseolus angularis TaxID=3914 RepID=UPI00080A1B92|nr:E3 ubiquitin-protein ligase PRT6 isoform X1 [Vigna angularis]XP_017418233.1 E3 ubiquitin-protein ligase PRT6 isoform X1 [Vigna angularis]
MADNMEIDSPSDCQPLKPRDRVVRRLAQFGVPEEQLDQPGLIAFVKDKRALIPELVSVILPTDAEVADAFQASRLTSKKMSGVIMKKRFHESMVWLQWLMFEGDPGGALRRLSEMSVGQRGVCGAVWGHNDIAYRCRTCEHDPTCAICVPCFEKGDHKGHDYCVIYTGGGCCDCGDVTAWKREGFCSLHQGAEQIQPLPKEFASSVDPVLGSLFNCWRVKLTLASEYTERKQPANELTYAVVDMLLEFCKHSESLLSFVARLLLSSDGLISMLVRAERFLTEVVVKKLHELLLKLLGEQSFKYDFAKVFLAYYPSVINEATKDSSDFPLKKYPLLPIFSVQILTVPTLTPRLLKETNLLTMLLGCVENIFVSCSDDGRLQVSRWANIFETTIRTVEDIRFVMSHVVVPKYVTNDQQDISRTWMRLLSFVQGMNPQKRETGQHIEEENENVHYPFILGHSIANIHSVLVDGAFSDASKGEIDGETAWNSKINDSDDGDNVRHAKVGRRSEESSACNVKSRSSVFAAPKLCEIKTDASSNLPLPRAVTGLICECLRAIENWLRVENIHAVPPNLLSPNSGSACDSNFSAFKRTISKFGRGKYAFGRLASTSEDHGKQCSENSEMDSENTCTRSSSDDNAMEEDILVESDGPRFLSLPDWPQIVYDVSSQDISVHIPLHRLLSMLLQKAMKKYFCQSEVSDVTHASPSNSLSTSYNDFFEQALRGSHPFGFSANIMEHPLRIRVFCAEVHAGMWRKNGDAALLSCELYRSVRCNRSEQGLELDLFLLQCCAALAPEDLFVSRILERFGLSNYLILNLERSSEHEPVLVQEMLTLIIQIIKERRFCGLTTAESLKRELIYKLSIGDATHSQLVKSLPRDLSKFEQLQDILDAVAVYSNPSGFNQGMYSLRWTFWKELDLYHLRWNSKDLQVAEERYLRFCNVSALTTQLPQWTKIHPPLKGIARIATCKVVLHIIRAAIFYAVSTFKSSDSRAPDSVLLPALHLLSLSLDICFQQKESSEDTCHDVAQLPIIALSGEFIQTSFGEQSLLTLLVLLMEMHRRENVDNFVEAGGCSLFTLIESLLKKFAEIDNGCMTKLQKLAPEVVCHISEYFPSRDSSISSLASESEKRKAKARDRQAAIMEKMRVQQTKFLASIDTTTNDGSQLGHEGDLESEQDSEESDTKQVVCSLCHDHNSELPISFLVLLQKSRLVSSVNRGPPSWEKLCQSDKEHTPVINTNEPNTSTMNWNTVSSGTTSSSHLNQLVQIAAEEVSSSGKPGEVLTFLQYVKNKYPALVNFQLPDTYDEKEKAPYSFETLEQCMYLSIYDEMRLPLSSNLMNMDDRASTAGENSNIIIETGSVLIGKYTADLVLEMSEISSMSEITSNESASVESTSQHPTYDEFGPIDCDGVHLSSCGHAVHQGCLDRYLSSLRERSVRRIVFEGGHIVDPDQGEFLCPVCRRLANCVLPTLPGELKKPLKQSIILSTGSINTAPPLAESSELTYSLRLQSGLKLLQSAATAVGKLKFLNSIPLHHIDRTRTNLENFLRVLSKMYSPCKEEKLSRFSRINHSMLMWDTLKYSLTSMEIAARCGKTSFTPNYALSALYEELKSSSGFILSLMFKLVQNTRSKNSLHVLQRFKGVQLFAESICAGVSPSYGNSDNSGMGDMLSILKHIEMDLSNTDSFWRQASDPVLAHDPFSTLMWVLFCLPQPFLSCEESLLSLVHVFYTVSVTQAIIIYHEKSKHKSSRDSDLSGCLITDIYKVMNESANASQYIVSNYFDPSVDIKDAIRRFTFPYLRRCALLWKILYSFIPPPFCDEENILDRPWSVPQDTMGNANIEMFEVTKIHELENMFKIPSLDVVLKDELSRTTVSNWCRHFCKEFESGRIQQNMHVTPAVPFKLMRLPNIYQDLLQRCFRQRCLACKSVLEDPALCLLCGRLCSPSWKSCCRESGCQSHAVTCGAGTGVFLLIRRTTILLQRSARQAPWPSLYLDAFGEEDFEMSRGKPLYLKEERYAALTYMVASHGLDRSSKVLGQTTIGSFFLV